MNFLKKLLKSKTTIVTSLNVTSSNGFHLRPIAKFVNEAKQYDATITLEFNGSEVSATQVPKILSLGLEKGDTFSLKCKGKASQKASEELSAFFKQLMIDDTEVEEIKEEDESYEGTALNGEIIAKGVAIAKLAKLKFTEHHSDNSMALANAIDFAIQDLDSLYEKNQKDPNAEIYLVQRQLLESDIFIALQDETPKVFQQLIQNEIDKLKGTAFESRAADYRDIEQRVFRHLGIWREYALPTTPFILLANDLLPSDIHELKDTTIEGVVLKEGSLTSHASILLRSWGIPSLIVKERIESSIKSTTLLDAGSGKLIVEPTQKDLEKAKAKQKEFALQKEKSHQNRFERVQTKNGQSVKILTNVTDLNSAKEAKEQGADGIGLLRTEFLFTEKKPTIEEQTQAYSDIFELFDEITVRTLDIGGDKSLPYIEIAKEDNPFLGIRGIRFSLQEKTLLKEQLLAVGLASANVKAKVIKIMFPMVSNTEEFKEAKNIAQRVAIENNVNIDHIQFGIMLEVPSVIFALKEFDQLVDFYSIGTNDLTQYLFAIERTHPTLETDISSPLLMNALKQIVKTTQKPISICGELAGLEEVTNELIEMGYSTLSVSPKLIPLLKEKIRKL